MLMQSAVTIWSWYHTEEIQYHSARVDETPRMNLLSDSIESK